MHRIMHPQQVLAVLGIRLAQICGAEGVNNGRTKIFQTLPASCIPDVKILVEHVRRSAVCQLTKRNRALRQRGWTLSVGRIFPPLEVLVARLQCVNNLEKQLSPHPKPSAKNRHAPPGIFGEVVLEQALMS